MRSLIISNLTQLHAAFCDELKANDSRHHPVDIALMGAHCGRITSDELYQMTFDGKFNFSNPD